MNLARPMYGAPAEAFSSVKTNARLRFSGFVDSIHRVDASSRPAMVSSEAQRQTLINSLRQRWIDAVRTNDAEAKQALFKEAVYLGIQPEDFTVEG